jgi:hypothetical protein
MKKKNVILLVIILVLVVLVGAGFFIFNHKSKLSPIAIADNQIIKKDVVDANGCKTSEGYVFSQVRKECLKLSEKGIELPPNASNPEKRSAYVVLAADYENGGWAATSSDAEAFLPGATSSLVMKTSEVKNTGWTKINGDFKLIFWDGIYYFSNGAEDNIMYQGSK